MSNDAHAQNLAHTHGPQSPALLTDTIGVTLARTVERYGDHIALIDAAADRQWTYTEFHRDVRALAAGLLRLGVAPGDRIGLWAPNRFEWVLTQYATAEIGAILVNLNPAYRQNEIEYALKQSGSSVVLAAERFKDSGYASMLAEARPHCPDLRTVVTFESTDWADLTATPSDEELARVADIAASLSADDPINIQYTSGTTGFPKGATLSHRNIGNNGYLVGELLDYTAEDRICLPVPFYHCFGMVMGNLAATSHGAAMVIPGPAFDPRATLDAVAEHRCTSLYGVPTMFIAELALLDAAPDGYAPDLSSLRTGIMAGSPCPEQVMRQVVDRMHMSEVSICYGMTETSPVSTQTRVDDPLELRVTTVGQVGPHLEIKIVAPGTGETLGRNETGELCTRGYSVMTGYWNDPEKTAEAIDADGWMHTGDLAEMDDAGYVRITGRIKDMVIRGGENIYPREIEEFLYTHPDILDAQVIGVPDEKYGEELMAWVRLRDHATDLTAEDVRAFADGKIARHKIPRYVHVVKEFPMTVTGKVRKVAMREEATSILEDLR
ncbi:MULTISPECIES: AMP-binding protein [Gordonia]|uniref:AMP-binding protein n=1 Tax=Gordonia amicalis TaxID=89053 RepID=A0ABU4DB36_9ACTN|nr:MULTISPECIES: AMP-binding protein [Gordonia]ATD69983.1 AMP-binding protein [Gordonia sp. 1D]KAF0969715.1 3-[(3aS,4S,7aS)-7a-methyl-1,5-dioxo-octahydro-1H-inden-4-yl]propanoyl:CoA ligase [Gordonia sp. YY1]MBA5845956.1 AMP-binding protein [Gordonia amicalis]MCZ4651818.1 AMP-binding protein [Gordonia amicalis]MDJ0454040.1 AMP-binding protein [Gordonia amicalis]